MGLHGVEPIVIDHLGIREADHDENKEFIRDFGMD